MVPRPALRELVGVADVWLLTLDTLRYDVAVQELAAGRTPHLADLLALGAGQWEARHTPGSFTYAAHHAFFAGFLPTPRHEPKADRLWAVDFPGNEDTSPDTWFTSEATVVAGLAAAGHRTLCVGGVGFFNPATALGAVLPGMFQESYWDPTTGVRDPAAFDHQIDWLQTALAVPDERPLFGFVNVPTIHQPNRHHLPDTDQSLPDDRASHAAALRAVDAALPRWLQLATRRGRPTLTVITSDHGTLYPGDAAADGALTGHRLAHETVWTVPYAEVWWP